MEGFWEGLADELLPIIVVLIGAVIWLIFSLKKDSRKKKTLTENLTVNGYSVGEEMNIPDKENHGKPFCFMVDFTNKKWFFAAYRAENAVPYDFEDVEDYKVKIRTKGTEFVKGTVIEYSAKEYSDNGILKSEGITADSCEYIEIDLTLGGSAKNSVSDKWIMYEAQKGEGKVNFDFVLSEVCISNAIKVESNLFKIMNKK